MPPSTSGKFVLKSGNKRTNSPKKAVKIRKKIDVSFDCVVMILFASVSFLNINRIIACVGRHL